MYFQYSGLHWLSFFQYNMFIYELPSLYLYRVECFEITLKTAENVGFEQTVRGRIRFLVNKNSLLI